MSPVSKGRVPTGMLVADGLRGRRALVTLAVLPLSLLLVACEDGYRYLRSGEVGWALKKALRDEQATRVDIARLTGFEWDELFLAGPYEPAENVCRRLRIAPDECRSSITVESVDDGEMLMVFRRKGKVVHIEKHLRFHGDFTPIQDAPFTPQTAVFDVSIKGTSASGEPWLKLTAAGFPDK